jgi:hypothetical protein
MMDDYRQLLELIKQERTKAPKPEQTTESNKGVSADRPLIEALAADVDDIKYKQTVLEEEIEKIKKRLESTVTLKLHYNEEE